MVEYLLAAAIGYLLGSFPTAYLVVKWQSNLDIRKQGSGNVGTLNSYEVTNSKVVGASVLLIDLAKGILSVLIVKEVIHTDFPVLAVGGIAAVIGHNFPVWLGFKGGRGLATAAGVMLMFSWVCVVLWMLAWAAGMRVSRDVNVGNAVATTAMVIIALLTPSDILSEVIPANASGVEFKVFVAILACVILLRLVQPVRQYIGSGKP